MLLAAPHRVNASGEIELTAAEADVLRACGFSDAAAGKWRLPPVPTDVWIPEYVLLLVPQLVRETPKVGASSSAVARCATTCRRRDDASQTPQVASWRGAAAA